MKLLSLFGGLIAFMNCTAFAQSPQFTPHLDAQLTQGHATGHADITRDSTRTSERGPVNAGITAGINHRASAG